ncbi:phage integrase N-terminal SAM-like domain-containing protein [Paraburkholderia sp. SIMBA_054]|uniref:phage integrase N-terminal SAM-like domain-containing protein n=1 Tax=Paraburkholderia sp. SIMBA_054 TaxID=3085795 RepID=UPI003979606E
MCTSLNDATKDRALPILTILMRRRSPQRSVQRRAIASPSHYKILRISGLIASLRLIRNLAENTQYSYLIQVSSFARHFQRSPELLGPEEIRAWLIHLREGRKLGVIVRNVQNVTVTPREAAYSKAFRSRFT